ncbi:hypothetical protein B9Z55_025357 [Caenorhabditis nigoni]|uniref:Uncharacterized protein n=1 Tax=Caenorhabditis nigoni TaxID=1611254 RepID=A0A2G5SYU5_9PELO|nr:hypothetical protein B9Z55_025357 [Caenorhabditis nigoni]
MLGYRIVISFQLRRHANANTNAPHPDDLHIVHPVQNVFDSPRGSHWTGTPPNDHHSPQRFIPYLPQRPSLLPSIDIPILQTLLLHFLHLWRHFDHVDVFLLQVFISIRDVNVFTINNSIARRFSVQKSSSRFIFETIAASGT